MTSPYETLGVPPDADDATIKRAYRKRAHKAHPDKGGKPEVFHAIARAWDILSDAQRRKDYDERGEMGDRPDPHVVALSSIAGVLRQLLDREDFEHIDVVSAIRDHFKQVRSSVEAKRKPLHKVIAKRELALARFHRKTEGRNVFEDFIRAEIREANIGLEQVKRDLAVADDILAVLAEYRFDVKIATPDSAPSMFSDIKRLDNLFFGMR